MEIGKKSQQWHHVPDAANPADHKNGKHRKTLAFTATVPTAASKASVTRNVCTQSEVFISTVSKLLNLDQVAERCCKVVPWYTIFKDCAKTAMLLITQRLEIISSVLHKSPRSLNSSKHY